MSTAIANMEHVHVLATSEEEARLMERQVVAEGGNLTRTTIWQGVVPEGSYMDICEGVRMSTPEFFFLRKSNELPFRTAIALGTELCGLYATHLTCSDFPIWYWESIPEQRTNKAKLEAYLLQCPDAPECQRALKVLAEVEDKQYMPM